MLPTEKLVEGTNTYKKCMDDYYKSLAPKWGIFGKKFELGKYAYHQTCQQCLTMLCNTFPGLNTHCKLQNIADKSAWSPSSWPCSRSAMAPVITWELSR